METPLRGKTHPARIDSFVKRVHVVEQMKPRPTMRFQGWHRRSALKDEEIEKLIPIVKDFRLFRLGLGNATRKARLEIPERTKHFLRAEIIFLAKYGWPEKFDAHA